MHAYSLRVTLTNEQYGNESTLRLNYIEYQTRAGHGSGIKTDLRKLVFREITVFETEIALLALAP